jgi:hypothetical protein
MSEERKDKKVCKWETMLKRLLGKKKNRWEMTSLLLF